MGKDKDFFWPFSLCLSSFYFSLSPVSLLLPPLCRPSRFNFKNLFLKCFAFLRVLRGKKIVLPLFTFFVFLLPFHDL